MNFKNLIISIILVLGFFVSCTSDDDICTSGEATPRIKIKFKTQSTGKLKTLDSLYLDVDYASGTSALITGETDVDSVLIPLRVDANDFTDIYVRLNKNGEKSKIRINYTTESEYVSPACGIKKMYKNVGSNLETANPVVSLELNQTQIINEDKTHLYLLF